MLPIVMMVKTIFTLTKSYNHLLIPLHVCEPDFSFTIYTVGGYYNMDVNTKLNWAFLLILRSMLHNCGDGEDDFDFNEQNVITF